jgi:hypothetical protein
METKRLPFRVLENGDIAAGRTGNVLLLKQEVGRAKPTVYHLPEFGHKYGVPSPTRMEVFKSGKLDS